MLSSGNLSSPIGLLIDAKVSALTRNFPSDGGGARLACSCAKEETAARMANRAKATPPPDLRKVVPHQIGRASLSLSDL
jgi:hypothetical protein